MTLTLRPLFSGSKGNSTYVEGGGARLLVDAGVSCARLTQALRAMDCDPAGLDGILITHEHSDHICGLDIFASKYGVKVYANNETWQAMRLARIPESQRVVVASGEDFFIKGLNVETYEKPHDAVRSLAYGFYAGGARGAVVTDIGHMTKSLLERLMGCNVLAIESNYDEQMLLCGPYPQALKKRIYGRNGHLSNRDCGASLCRLVAAGARQVALMHLSEENNTPDTAYGTVDYLLTGEGIKTGRDVRIIVARQDEPCDELSV